MDDRYRLDAVIGVGATATVHRGFDLLLNRPVAVKVFSAAASQVSNRARQRLEMQTLAVLNSPHLVAVYDARIQPAGDAVAEGIDSYLVLELVDGSTLSTLIVADELLEADIRDIGRQVASGLRVVHELGFVHRDVKPGNIFVTRAGVAKLGDFGLVRVLDPEQTDLTGAAVLGTAAYLAPEQVLGQPALPASDIYALGLVLLEAITGRREYTGEPLQAALARMLREPVIPDDLPAPWPNLLARMTASDPAARPVAADVARLLGDTDSESDAFDDVPAQNQHLVEGATMSVALPTVEAAAHTDRAVLTLAGAMSDSPSRARPDRARIVWWTLAAAAVAGVLASGVLLLTHLRASDATVPATDGGSVVIASTSAGPGAAIATDMTARTAPPPVSSAASTSPPSASRQTVPATVAGASTLPTTARTSASVVTTPKVDTASRTTQTANSSTSSVTGTAVVIASTTPHPTAATTQTTAATQAGPSSTPSPTNVTTRSAAPATTAPSTPSSAKNRGQSRKALRTKPPHP